MVLSLLCYQSVEGEWQGSGKVVGINTKIENTRQKMYPGILFVLHTHFCPLKISNTSIKLHIFPIPSPMKRGYKLVNFILFATEYSQQ